MGRRARERLIGGTKETHEKPLVRIADVQIEVWTGYLSTTDYHWSQFAGQNSINKQTMKPARLRVESSALQSNNYSSEIRMKRVKI
jgi:hypothetical protein